MQYFARSGNFVQPVEEQLSGVSDVQPTASATGLVEQIGAQLKMGQLRIHI